MKGLPFLITVFLLGTISSNAFSQDTLPKFSVKNIGNNRIIVGWVNTYPQLKQISIQRSFDSLNNYKTILSVTDPNAIQNGFADTKAPNDHMFYRLFVVPATGDYFFTKAQKPVLDTAKAVVKEIPPVVQQKLAIDTVTKEVVKSVIKKPEFIPSVYIYTNKDGYVYINLPDANEKKYHVKFMESDGSPLFEIKNIKESGLTLDKSNFLHSGWFLFELFDNNKLVEKHKLYLAKDF